MATLVGILFLAALIVIHEAGHFLVARAFGMRVKKFSIGFMKPIFEWTPRGSETTYSIGALPLGGYVQVDGLSPVDDVDPDDRANYANQPIYAKLAMIVAGPIANFLTAVILFTALFAAGMPVPTEEPFVGRVIEGRVAHEAGLRQGDLILSIGGEPVQGWSDIPEKIQGNRGKATVVRIRRGEEEQDVTLTPDPTSGRIGIAQATRPGEPMNVFSALGRGFTYSAVMTAGLAVMVGRMVTGQRGTEGVAGPVGIVGLLANSLQEGWRSLFSLMAQLSISLCLFNFLPIPALDGGRVTFLAIEGITRRRVSRKIEGYVHAVGLILVLGLVLLVTFRDVLNLL